MAVPANTTITQTRVGIREDLEDWISNISPDETPFMSSIGSATASQHFTEWQTDELDPPNGDNKMLEGGDLDNEARSPTKRLGSYTQIFTKTISTSTTAQATKTAGRANEHNYQVAKAARSLKRDEEVRFCGNYAGVGATNTVEGETAGAVAWIETNVSRGVGGANATVSNTVTAAAVDGDLRDFTEALFKEQLHGAWESGGEPDRMIVGGRLKQTAAAFPGIADLRNQTSNKKATIVAGADIYVSDFGNIMFIPTRFMGGRSGVADGDRNGNREALIYDPSLWSVATLEPMQRTVLSKTGLADRLGLHCNKALRCHNEKGNALIADLQPVAV